MAASRFLSHLSPEADEVLSPERSTQGAAALLSRQRRQPISRSSIGSGRNEERAFDRSWDPLVAAHESRRRW